MITDADGNVTHLPLSSVSLDLTYDYENRLTNANGTSYSYDLLGNRIHKKTSQSTSNYIVNPNSGLSQVLVTEKDGKTTYYVYGIGLVSEETYNQAKYYHFDVRGSTVALTDQSGSVTDEFSYDTYGNLISHTGITDTEYQYCGQYGVQTDENGLIYMRARYYSPEIGRFLSLDPVLGDVSDSQSLNRYAFCTDDPVNSIDPDGNEAIAAIVGIGSIVTVGFTYLVSQVDWGEVYRGISDTISDIENGANKLKNLVVEAVKNASSKSVEKDTDKSKEKDCDKGTVKEVKIEKSAERQIKRLSPESQKSAKEIIEDLKKGNFNSHKNHPLGKDRKGQWAMDIDGGGKGRGAKRLVYTFKDGIVNIIEIILKHDYRIK